MFFLKSWLENDVIQASGKIIRTTFMLFSLFFANIEEKCEIFNLDNFFFQLFIFFKIFTILFDCKIKMPRNAIFTKQNSKNVLAIKLLYLIHINQCAIL